MDRKLRGGQPGIVGLNWTKPKQQQSDARTWNGTDGTEAALRFR